MWCHCEDIGTFLGMFEEDEKIYTLRLHIIAVSRKQGMCQNLLSLFLAEIVSKWFKSSSSIVVKIEIIILLANLNVVLETFLFLLVDLVGFFWSKVLEI